MGQPRQTRPNVLHCGGNLGSDRDQKESSANQSEDRSTVLTSPHPAEADCVAVNAYRLAGANQLQGRTSTRMHWATMRAAVGFCDPGLGFTRAKHDCLEGLTPGASFPV